MCRSERRRHSELEMEQDIVSVDVVENLVVVATARCVQVFCEEEVLVRCFSEEDILCATAIRFAAISNDRAWGIAALTGMVEPIGGLLGAGIITLSETLLPWGLAFAAGAMLYVISHEIIPETHRSGHQNRATLGLAVGLVLMLFLDVWLG